MSVLVCPYCGASARLVDSAMLYNGVSYGFAWVCGNYPGCDAYVGCHRGSRIPLGCLADAQLRGARKLAHSHFDCLWRSGRMRRSAAYSWLAERLGLGVEDTHIARFDLGQCARVVEVVCALEPDDRVRR